MNITAIAADSKITNIAIEKIKLYHQNRGDVVYDLDCFIPVSDIAYISTVFTKSREAVSEYLMYDNVVIGGTGWDIDLKLPKEIDAMRPKINIGFATRGCNNRCSFCVVHQKEGNAYIESDLYDIWDGKSKLVTLLDNNILQIPDHFKTVCNQAINSKIRIDFNQGLDHKLLTDEICETLKQVRSTRLRFAFDNIAYMNSVKNAMKLLNKHKIKNTMWYVLVGFNSTIDEDMERIMTIKNYGHDPYVMRHENCNGKAEYNDLAAWVNQPQFFKKTTLYEFIKIRHKGGCYEC